MAFGNTRTSKDQRRLHARIVQVLLAQKSMTPKRNPLVSREYDQCVIQLTRCFQMLQNPPHMMIKSHLNSIVFMPLLLDHTRWPWSRSKLFVANLQIAVVERMLG